MARFDFEGEHSDELSFSEGDVVQLKAYVGQDWARGQMGTFIGIFPLNFVEVIEDLPPPLSQQQQQRRQPENTPEAAKPAQVADISAVWPRTHTHVVPVLVFVLPAAPSPLLAPQASPAGGEWVVALYDFAGNADGDLSFQQGDRILVRQHIDSGWSCGCLNGREGIFPRAFVDSTGRTSTLRLMR